jgi:hypothetical protein
VASGILRVETEFSAAKAWKSLTADSVVAVVAATAGLLLYFKKRRRQTLNDSVLS